MKSSNKKNKEVIILIITVVIPVLIGIYAEDPAKSFIIITSISIIVFTILLVFGIYPRNSDLKLFLKNLYVGCLLICLYSLIDKFCQTNYLIKIVFDGDNVQYWWIQWYSLLICLGLIVSISIIILAWKKVEYLKSSDYAKYGIKGVLSYISLITVLLWINDILLVIPNNDFNYFIKIDFKILISVLVIAPFIIHYIIYSYYSLREYQIRVDKLRRGKNDKI